MGLFAHVREQQAGGHSPFVQAVLGPVADLLRPSDPLADEAAAICERAVLLFDTDWASALDLLRRSAGLGHVDSVFFLGAGLWRCAAFGTLPTREANEDMGLEGLGWLEHAMELGHLGACDFFADALASLDDRLYARWAALPARYVVTVQ